MIFLPLLFAATIDRPYHSVPVSEFEKSKHTQVCTTGVVSLIKKQADGDMHYRINDGPAFIVAEQIPTLKGVTGKPPKKVGEKVTVCGTRRYDDAPNHNWWEIHPIESWK